MAVLKRGVTFDDPAGAIAPHGAADHIAALVGSALYAGFVPVGAGTVGSLWVPVLYFLVAPNVFHGILWIGTPLVFLAGVWAAWRCERFWGPDPGRVVIDEVAGMLVTLVALPMSPAVVGMGFLLFRLFDILKPQPARWADGIHSGWGVMLDDVFAGLYANLCLQVLVRLAPNLF